MIGEYRILRTIDQSIRQYQNASEGSLWLGGAVYALQTLRKDFLVQFAESHDAHKKFQGRVNQWKAGTLYRAVRQGLNYLKRGDRAKAIERLEGVL